jgi:hypothetical protein
MPNEERANAAPPLPPILHPVPAIYGFAGICGDATRAEGVVRRPSASS